MSICNISSWSICQKEKGELLSPCVKVTAVVLCALLTLTGVFSLLNSFGIFNFGLGTIGSTWSYVMIGVGFGGILIALDYTKKIITGQKLRAEYRFIAVSHTLNNGTGTIKEARILKDRLSVIDQIPIASFASGFVRLVASIVHILTHLTLSAFSRKHQDEHLEEVSLAGRNFVQATLAMIPIVGNFILWLKNRYNKNQEEEKLPEVNTLGVATLFEMGQEIGRVDALQYFKVIGRKHSGDEVLDLFQLDSNQKNRFGGFSIEVEGRKIHDQLVEEEVFNEAINKL